MRARNNLWYLVPKQVLDLREDCTICTSEVGRKISFIVYEIRLTIMVIIA